MKKKLTQAEEFEIMKLVLDKFLWLGFGIMIYGLYKMVTVSVSNGIGLLIAGAIVVVIFMVLIIKEYEITA
jgi:hypothetical protein